MRKKKQATAVKQALSRLGIHAITVDESKILESEESIYVLFLLQAMLDIKRSTIYKALLGPFTGFTSKEIVALDEELEYMKELTDIIANPIKNAGYFIFAFLTIKIKIY